MDELLPESENWCLSITARNVNELENRKDILLAHISNMPGIRYRELSRLTGLSNGILHILSVKCVEGYQLYSVMNPELISNVLYKYEQSPLQSEGTGFRLSLKDTRHDSIEKIETRR